MHRLSEPLQEQSHAGLCGGQAQLESPPLPAQLLQLFPKTLSYNRYTHTHTPVAEHGLLGKKLLIQPF